MRQNLDEFTKAEFDLLIIGGGINGAGLAHLAQAHGLKTALIEKSDFASGTSSKTTKLIHGGIRYLENLDFGLVIESLRERALQLNAAPHLVKPLPFIIPVYRGDRRPLWLIRLGVLLYDSLAGKYSVGPHRNLSADEISELIPAIKRDGLIGGVLYYDARMDDARLCLENILSAREKGAKVANYVEAESFIKEDGKTRGILAKDVFGGFHFEIRAKNVILAVGPWTNYLLRKDSPMAKKRIRTTKGVHIVYEERFSDHAVLLPSDRDGRVFFVIPWMGHSLIGTTDTNYAKSPDGLSVSNEDIRYLAENTRRVFPNADFSQEKIITSFAGLRPLVRRRGSPSKVTRDHAIVKTGSGLVFVTGGKYTTYRKIAEDTLWKVFRIRAKKPFSLYGSSSHRDVAMDGIAKKYNIDTKTLAYLIDKYGARCQEVLSLIEKDRSLAEKLCDCSPAIKAQVVYSIQNEMAITADDIISRRLSLQFYPCITKRCRETVDKMINH